MALKFSVIIPAYNNAEYLGEAIQSVIDQTYPHFEIIVINDASPDNVSQVVRQFSDLRIKYIIHDQNRGLSAARNTGIRSSSGDLIALLDGDDIFHREKLQAHVAFLEQHPEIGVTYNGRFELNHSAKTIRELWRPPPTVTLADLVFGFPFSPSDMVVRREWIFRVNLFDEYHVYVGEDLDINCRLALAGCKFASVDRALNYRRYHSGRIIKDLRRSVEDTLRPLRTVFADPRCPQHVLALRDQAIANHYLLWSAIAFVQNDTKLGQEYCTEAIRRNPTIVRGSPSLLLQTLISYSIVDESVDHARLLCRMAEQLPPEFMLSSEQCKWAIARGYLLRGTRAVMWGRFEDGREHFKRAAELSAQVDESLLSTVTAQLLDYENEFGPQSAQDVFEKLCRHYEEIGGGRAVRWLKGNYMFNRAVINYRVGKYGNVPRNIMVAFASNPRHLKNRGAWSMLFRSAVGGWKLFFN